MRVVRTRTAKFVNFAVLLPMSAARDKLKCYALDLSLLAVTEKKTFANAKVLEWRTQTDSNRQPSESESDALSSCAMGAY